jgi:hypothetical protein
MDHLRLTYQILGKAGRGELLLDLHSQHWTAQKVAQAIVKHEFPALEHLEMQGHRWSEESILYLFGIEGVSYSYESRRTQKSTGKHATE